MDDQPDATTTAPQTPAPVDPPPALTPAEVVAARARQRALIEESARRKLVPEVNPWTHTLAALARHPAPLAGQVVTNGVPATRRFALEHVRRVPVTLSAAARAFITSSSHEGRLFPHALSEAFGALAGVAGLHIALVSKHEHFSVVESERHPVTGAWPRLLDITVTHGDDPWVPPHRYFTNAEDLATLDPRTHLPAFQAWAMAAELARLYPYRDAGA